MSTVYQFGKLWFQKDLVFGWCIGTEGKHFTPLSSVSNDWLELIENMNFPVYVPPEFKQNVLEEVKHRERERNTAKLNQAYGIQHKVETEPTFENITKLPRYEDKNKLMADISTAMTTDITGGIHADLGYLTIRKYFGGENYTIVLDKKKIATFENIDDLVEFILRRWW